MIESFRKRRWPMAAIALALLAAGAIAIGMSNRHAEPGGAIAPGIALGGFVSQTDGKYGYQMLRPAGWTSHDAQFATIYSDVPDGPQARLLLFAYNVGVTGRAHPDPNGGIVEWEAFKGSPGLDGWTSVLERDWRHDGMRFALLEALPNAKVYWWAPPDGSRPNLSAYVVDGGQPLIVGLSGGAAQPAFEPLDRLRADGVLADFISMVRSLRAIPADPENVSPSLGGATGDAHPMDPSPRGGMGA